MSFHDEMDHIASAAEMGEFAAQLPNPYEVFGVAQSDEPKRVKSRPPLMCGHEECDFTTFDSLEWQLHQMDSGHELYEEEPV